MWPSVIFTMYVVVVEVMALSKLPLLLCAMSISAVKMFFDIDVDMFNSC